MHSEKQYHFSRLFKAGWVICISLKIVLLSGCNSIWLYRPNDKIYKAMVNISPDLPYFIPSASGNQLHTLLIPAKPPSSPKKTVLVHFHGNATNLTWTSQRYDWLTDYGYDLLVFDYSGYGHSTGSPDPNTTTQDGVAILDHVLELNASDRWERIFLMGTSLGGTVLLQSISQHQAGRQFDLVFIDSSFLSYREVAASMIRKGYGGFAFDWIGKLIISDQYAPVNQLEQIPAIPLIVAHCEDDRLIDIELGYNLYNQLPMSPKVFWPLQGCEHARGFFQNQPEHRKQLLALFNRQ